MEGKKLLIFGALLALLLLLDHAHSANILVISFFSGISNKITYHNLVEELGQRGHNLTIVSPIKPIKPMKNVNEIFTLDMGPIVGDGSQFNVFSSKEKGQGGSMTSAVMLDIVYRVCNQTYDLPHVRSLLQEKFDLVIHLPLFNDCVLGLIHRLQVPFVMFTPTTIPPWIMSKIGGHFPPSFFPNFLMAYQPEMSFRQRFISYGADRMVDLFNMFLYEPKIEQLYREKLGEDVPSINEIIANASLALSNGHFSLAGPKPYFPDVIDVGGIHSRPAKPIPKDLEDFIGKGKDGFIMFSMGSFIKGSTMSEVKRRMILNVFSKLKQQILWKWDEESMPDLPKNVKLSKWLPQQDLLGHKDIKMFITHCGGGSTEESIYNGVPLVGLPMTSDQPMNAALAKKHGMIVELQWEELTEENFLGAIQEILNNPKYRDNAKKLSDLFKDRPMDPLEVGVYWIEYVLRHKGAPHLRSAGRKLNAFQYHSYDVIGAYLAIIGAALYLIYAILRFICSKLFCRSGNGNNKTSTLINGKKRN